METIKLKSHIGKDGILKLEMPAGISDVDCEVTVTIKPKLSQAEWVAFLEETAGILADDPIERGSQGEYETRDELV
jgi:hypothetical protein